MCQSKPEAPTGVDQNENEMVESCHIFYYFAITLKCTFTIFWNDVGERCEDAGIDKTLATFVEAPPDSD